MIELLAAFIGLMIILSIGAVLVAALDQFLMYVVRRIRGVEP